jgi:hypothetical protein
MNPYVFLFILVIMGHNLAYPQSTGNALYRRGVCASGGVCLTKRTTAADLVSYLKAAGLAHDINAVLAWEERLKAGTPPQMDVDSDSEGEAEKEDEAEEGGILHRTDSVAADSDVDSVTTSSPSPPSSPPSWISLFEKGREFMVLLLLLHLLQLSFGP